MAIRNGRNEYFLKKNRLPPLWNGTELSGSRKAHTISICPFLITKSRNGKKKYRLLTVRLPRKPMWCNLCFLLDPAPEYNLPEPSGLMTAKTYKTKFAEPLIKRLKSLIKTVFARCFEAWDSYHRLNATNASLYRENQVLSRKNSSLNAENAELKEQNRDYKLLRKVFGSKQIDGLLEQAKQSKQRDKRFRDNQNER